MHPSQRLATPARAVDAASPANHADDAAAANTADDTAPANTSAPRKRRARPVDSRLLTLTQAWEEYGLSTRVLNTLIVRRKLPFVRLTESKRAMYFLKREALERYIDQIETPALVEEPDGSAAHAPARSARRPPRPRAVGGDLDGSRGNR